VAARPAADATAGKDEVTVSKLRDRFEQDFTVGEGDMQHPEEGDLRGYVVFTRLRADKPWRYAGWLRAADDDEAVYYAREHYGRDQKVEDVLAIHESWIGGTDVPWPARDDDTGAERPFMVFTQKIAGDDYLAAEDISATGTAAALEAARGRHAADGPSAIWVADVARVLRRGEDDPLWREFDQTYRLARGYTAEVKRKWTQFRDADSLASYQKDDLKKEF
jgi:1,2-phenylacetyl-CoA epoxidase PaaB subunit